MVAPGQTTNTPSQTTTTPGQTTNTPGQTTNTPGQTTNTPGLTTSPFKLGGFGRGGYGPTPPVTNAPRDVELRLVEAVGGTTRSVDPSIVESIYVGGKKIPFLINGGGLSIEIPGGKQSITVDAKGFDRKFHTEDIKNEPIHVTLMRKTNQKTPKYRLSASMVDTGRLPVGWEGDDSLRASDFYGARSIQNGDSSTKPKQMRSLPGVLPLRGDFYLEFELAMFNYARFTVNLIGANNQPDLGISMMSRLSYWSVTAPSDEPTIENLQLPVGVAHIPHILRIEREGDLFTITVDGDYSEDSKREFRRTGKYGDFEGVELFFHDLGNEQHGSHVLNIRAGSRQAPRSSAPTAATTWKTTQLNNWLVSPQSGNLGHIRSATNQVSLGNEFEVEFSADFNRSRYSLMRVLLVDEDEGGPSLPIFFKSHPHPQVILPKIEAVGWREGSICRINIKRDHDVVAVRVVSSVKGVAKMVAQAPSRYSPGRFRTFDYIGVDQFKSFGLGRWGARHLEPAPKPVANPPKPNVNPRKSEKIGGPSKSGPSARAGPNAKPTYGGPNVKPTDSGPNTRNN